jgi:hypothetical protein
VTVEIFCRLVNTLSIQYVTVFRYGRMFFEITLIITTFDTVKINRYGSIRKTL